MNNSQVEWRVFSFYYFKLMASICHSPRIPSSLYIGIYMTKTEGPGYRNVAMSAVRRARQLPL